MKSSEPTELVSCGKCSTVNTVPFGLDKFMCYGCGTMVTIAREQSAACAAASTTAQFYDQREAQTTGGGGSVTPSGEGRRSEGSSGFFGKLQKTMDKTMQKV